jgi:hypothetical protein
MLTGHGSFLVNAKASAHSLEPGSTDEELQLTRN